MVVKTADYHALFISNNYNITRHYLEIQNVAISVVFLELFCSNQFLFVGGNLSDHFCSRKEPQTLESIQIIFSNLSSWNLELVIAGVFSCVLFRNLLAHVSVVFFPCSCDFSTRPPFVLERACKISNSSKVCRHIFLSFFSEARNHLWKVQCS